MNMTSEWLRDYELRRRVKNGTTQVVPENAVTVEKDLHYDIIEECKRRGWPYVHSRMDKVSTQSPGIPDFVIAASGGRTFWVEAKTKTGKQSTEQRGFEMMLNRVNHCYAVVRSMEEFLSFLSSTKSDTPNSLAPTSQQTPNAPAPSTPQDAGCSRD